QWEEVESSLFMSSQSGVPVVWHLNRSAALPLHRVTSEGSLVLLHVEHSAQGDYSCYDSQGLLLHSVRLRLGHPPGLLNISCQVPNHTHVRCSWVESVKTFLPAQYNASFRPCVMDVAHKHCDVYHPAFWQTIHTLSVTETNGLGSKSTSDRFRLHELLKPDPPESVLVQQLEGYSQRLTVSWNFPSSWPLHTAFPLVFHIRYRPLGSMYWSEIYSEESPVVISDALAGHLHQVQVRARDEVNNESQWSDWSPLLLVRPWKGQAEKPSSVNQDEGNLGLVIVLVLFSLVILITVLSLVFVVWVRQKRRDHVTVQELASVVKMKSMPI
uniref:Fibronectin type-III domain-containing protein n=1 Tax=Mola mola TaxID=94237 RepID=A0A3Q3XA16_MOLML